MSILKDKFMAAQQSESPWYARPPQQSAFPTLQLPAYQNPHNQVNPIYMQQQQSNDLAPMQMYQAYLAGQQMQNPQSNFQSWENPSFEMSAPPSSLPTSPTTNGGK